MLRVFDCLDQDMRQIFGVRHRKILCHAYCCVGVLHAQQLLIICDQLHTVSVCMRFRNFELVLPELT